MATLLLLAGCIVQWALLASSTAASEKPYLAGCYDYQPTSCALMPLEASSGHPFLCHHQSRPCKTLPTFDMQEHFRCPIAASGVYSTRAEVGPCTVQTTSRLPTQDLPSHHSRNSSLKLNRWMHDDSAHYTVSIDGKVMRDVDHLHVLDCLQGPPPDNLVFVGDSMMRQLFSRFVHVMRNQSRILDIDFHGHATFTLHHNDSLSWDTWELADPSFRIRDNGDLSWLVSSAGEIASARSASWPPDYSVRSRVQADFLWAVRYC